MPRSAVLNNSKIFCSILFSCPSVFKRLEVLLQEPFFAFLSAYGIAAWLLQKHPPQWENFKLPLSIQWSRAIPNFCITFGEGKIPLLVDFCLKQVFVLFSLVLIMKIQSLIKIWVILSVSATKKKSALDFDTTSPLQKNKIKQDHKHNIPLCCQLPCFLI